MNALTTQWSLITTVLKEERAREAGRLRIDDAAFLPAALEVIERPVSPTARLSAKVLLIGMGVLVLWLTFGRTDIVASANGRIVPTGAVQLVQPSEAGVVRRILVHDGDHVTKGQVLVLLDPTISSAEAMQAAKAYEAVAFEVARTRTVVDALDGKGFAFIPPDGADAATIATQASLARAKLADIYATIHAQVAGGAVASADIAAAQAEAAKLRETLPLLDQQIDANEQMLAKGYVSKLKVIDMRRQRIAQARDYDAAMQSIRRASAQAGGAASNATKVRADMRTALLEQLVKASADMRLRREEMVKTRQRSTLQALRAPVSGNASIAHSGALTCFVSGPKAAFERVLPVIASFTRARTYLGSAEEARYAKLAVNLMIAVSAGMMAESLALARKGGIAWQDILNVLDDSAIASPMVKYKTAPLRRRDFESTFSCRQMAKDLDLILGAGHHVDVPLPLAAHMREVYGSLIAQGEGEVDFIAPVRLAERLSGLGEPDGRGAA